MVNETFVRRIWPGQDPIGKHLGGGRDPLIEVVGVVSDVSAEETTKAAPPQIYFHFPQLPIARIALAVRADRRVYGSPGALEPAVRQAIAAADPSSPPLQFAEMQRIISDRIAPHRLSAQLIAVFAGLALLLAAVGHLRRALLQCGAAHARDRAADGAGCGAEYSAAADRGRGIAIGSMWNRDWAGGSAGADTRDEGDVVRGGRERSGDLCGQRGGIAGDCDGGGGSAGIAGRVGGPDGVTAGGVGGISPLQIGPGCVLLRSEPVL